MLTEANQQLEEGIAGTEGSQSISLIDARGTIVASSNAKQLKQSRSDRKQLTRELNKSASQARGLLKKQQHMITKKSLHEFKSCRLFSLVLRFIVQILNIFR